MLFSAIGGPHSRTLLTMSILRDFAAVLLSDDMYRSRSWWV